MSLNLKRIERLIEQSITHFDLNLNNLSLITEAATGIYFITPIIAASTGAKVTAFARDTKWTSADEAIDYTRDMAKRFNTLGNIQFTKKLSEKHISKADIITNLGAVRPINHSIISKMKPTSVIPLFCEPWEIRPDDIDLELCNKKEIFAVGTNEDAPELKVFDYTAPLILKMLFEAKLEVYKNRFLILSNDKFGQVIERTLSNNGAVVKSVAFNTQSLDLNKHDHWDAIIIADYIYKETIIGKNGILTPQNIMDYFPDTTIIQFAGKIDDISLKNNQIPFYPDITVPTYRMAKTFDFLGPQPVIELHTAGLKTAEIVCNLRKINTFQETIKSIEKLSICSRVF